jgi:hypothetical protein
LSLISYLPPGPVAEAFHADDSFVRGLMGPVGSGKSSTCCVEVMSRALQQAPDQRGVRSSRWAILRNSYPELKSTTIKTWDDWFGPISSMKWDSPITSATNISDIGDGTSLELEVMFFAMDRPEDVGKMRSLELTGAWMNEAGLMEKAVLDMLTQRVGRYPAKRNGGPTWTGVIMDTNPPDDDSWFYKLFEEDRPKGYKLLKQPGGLYLDADEESLTFGDYLPNSIAENVHNLPSGFMYYLRQLSGKTEDWVKVFLCGLYGTTMDGKPVYPEFKDSYHVASGPIEPIKGLPIVLSFDFGLTPACTFLQMSPRGQLLVLGECVSEDMGIRQFYGEVVLPEIRSLYSGFRIEACGDPAGTIRSQTNEKTCMQELLDMGLLCEPSVTNEFIARREAVAFFLQRNVAGEPGMLIDPRCKHLRKAFNGGYRYERIRASGSTRYRDRPVKDKHSHVSDSMQYGCLQIRNEMQPIRAQTVQKKRVAWA